MKFKTLDKVKLYDLIKTAYSNEVQMEQIGLWEGHLVSHRKLREVVLRLSKDSREHKKILERIMASLRDFDISMSDDEAVNDLSVVEQMGEKDIAHKIKSVEDRMLKTYNRIRSGIDIQTLKSIYMGDQPEDMISEIDKLIRQETGHQRILKNFIADYKKPEL